MKKLAKDPLNIVICGIGGQGNVLASEIVATATAEMGYRVAVGETYGAAQRGGSVMSHVRISENKELGVLIPAGEAHIILGFEPLETLRMARRYAGAGTVAVYDPRPVYPLGVLLGEQEYPKPEALAAEIAALCAKAVAVNAAEIAAAAGDSRAANIALLGAMSELEETPLGPEDLLAILEKRFHGTVLELNQKAFAMGREAACKGGEEA